MDRWAWDQLNPWLEIRQELPIGALLCVIHRSTAGRRWEPSAARKQLHRAAAQAGVRRRFAPHQLRHAHAVEMAHEGVPLVVIQRQLSTPTSASRASTCKASTAARSSARSTDDRRRPSRPPPASRSTGRSRGDWVGLVFVGPTQRHARGWRIRGRTRGGRSRRAFAFPLVFSTDALAWLALPGSSRGEAVRGHTRRGMGHWRKRVWCLVPRRAKTGEGSAPASRAAPTSRKTSS